MIVSIVPHTTSPRATVPHLEFVRQRRRSNPLQSSNSECKNQDLGHKAAASLHLSKSKAVITINNDLRTRGLLTSSLELLFCR